MTPLIDKAELRAEIEVIEGESIGWQPLENRAYLHVGKLDDMLVTVVGVPEAWMVGMNVLLLG